jgi:hypothetical protein
MRLDELKGPGDETVDRLVERRRIETRTADEDRRQLDVLLRQIGDGGKAGRAFSLSGSRDRDLASGTSSSVA